MKRYKGLIMIGLCILNMNAYALQNYESTEVEGVDVVQYTEGPYTRERLEQEIIELEEVYEGLIQVQIIGHTQLGTPIYAIKLGKGTPNIFLNGAHHGREWMTSVVLMEMVDTYAKAYVHNEMIDGYDVREVLDNTSIWVLPMLNVDGVHLQQGGLESFPEEIQSQLLKYNHGSEDFSLWKSNVPEAIDPNRQYPMNFYDSFVNVPDPSPWGHRGTEPAQINEVRGIIEFVETIQPELSVAYHSAGEIIYWGYETMVNRAYSQALVEGLQTLTTYEPQPLSDKPHSSFTDWFIATYDRPAFTMEIGSSVGRAVPDVEYPQIMEENKAVGLFLAEAAYNNWLEKENLRLEQQKAFYLGNLTYLIQEEENKVFSSEGEKQGNYEILEYLYVKKYEMFPEETGLTIYNHGQVINLESHYELNEEDLRPYVPMEQMFKLLNWELEWLDNESKIVLWKDKEIKEIIVEEDGISLEGDYYESLWPKSKESDRYLPIDFYTEHFSSQVTYLKDGELLIIEEEAVLK